MYIRPLGNHYMMVVIKKWIWKYITFPLNENIKRVNIMVYQNQGIKNVVSVEKEGGH
jgi:hypothetical protein